MLARCNIFFNSIFSSNKFLAFTRTAFSSGNDTISGNDFLWTLGWFSSFSTVNKFGLNGLQSIGEGTLCDLLNEEDGDGESTRNPLSDLLQQRLDLESVWQLRRWKKLSSLHFIKFINTNLRGAGLEESLEAIELSRTLLKEEFWIFRHRIFFSNLWKRVKVYSSKKIFSCQFKSCKTYVNNNVQKSQ